MRNHFMKTRFPFCNNHKKINAHIANLIKNVWTGETEDAKEMSKEKDLLDINDLVDFLYKQKF